MEWTPWVIVGVIALLIGVLIVLAVFIRYFRLWIQSKTTGAGITIFDLLGMTFRKVSPSVIVRGKIMATQAGLGDRARGLPPGRWRPTTWPAGTCPSWLGPSLPPTRPSST